jgi:hypothetical protein
MERISLKRRLEFAVIAKLACITTLSRAVMAPIASSGGLA